MDRDELLTLFDRQVRFEAIEARYAHEPWPADAPRVMRDWPRDEARWGWVIWSDLDAETADAAIQAQIDFFRARGQSFEWKLFGHDRPADLGARLLRHGFTREEDETVMACDLHANALGPAPAEQPAGAAVPEIAIRRITHPGSLRAVVQINEMIYGERFDWIETELAAELSLPGEPTVVYLAEYYGLPVAAGWMRFYRDTQFAGLFGGATLYEYRRRGIYTALLAARAAEARRRGYRFLSVDASPMSRPILRKRGFIELTTATAYKYRVAPESGG